MSFTERRPIERGFAAVFDTEIAPKLEGLEAARKSAKAKSAQRFAIGAGAGVAIGGLVVLMSGNWLLFAIIALVGLVAGIIMASIVQGGWKSAVADAVMPPVCRFLGDLEYDRQVSSGFPLGQMRALGLFGAYNRSTVNHKLSGRWRDTPFEMVQAYLRRKSTGSSSDNTVIVFQGLLFAIGVPGEAPTRIQIARDHGGAINKMVGLLTPGGGREMPRVAFDYPPFETLFEVYAEDPEAARTYMPQPFLDTLIAIGEEEGGRDGAQSLTAGFEGAWFYLALNRKLGFLDLGKIGQSMDSIEEQIHAVFDDIAIIRRIIDRLHGIDADT